MVPRMSISLVTTKAQQRTAALARRDALPVSERRAASQKIAQRRFPVPFGEGTVVAGYSPVRSECDPIPLMRSLAGKGVQLALPVIEKDKTLSFAEWRQGEQLTAGPFGILQPRPGALDVEPDIILVPLVGFDRAGHRIGYGVGYYDRTLQALRARRPVVAVGIAFATQQIDAVVAEATDQLLDLVLTELEVVDPRAR